MIEQIGKVIGNITNKITINPGMGDTYSGKLANGKDYLIKVSDFIDGYSPIINKEAIYKVAQNEDGVELPETKITKSDLRDLIVKMNLKKS